MIEYKRGGGSNLLETEIRNLILRVQVLGMEEKKLSIQNIIGRVTHGLVGMDVFLNEGRSNDYLKDFLTLNEDEIKTVFLSSGSKKRLIPREEAELSDEENAFIGAIRKTRELIVGIDRADPTKIEDCINELGGKIDTLYAAIPER